MLVATIRPSRLEGRVDIPPSKSHSLRAILLASMVRGTSQVRGVLNSPDVAAMITACRQMGAQIDQNGMDLLIKGVAGQPAVPAGGIDCGNSGQVLRFAAVMAAFADGTFQLDGDQSIRTSRPVRPMMEGLNQLGATCVSLSGNDHAPLAITGPISAGKIRIDGSDSQPVSAFLMAGAFMKGTTEILVDTPGETPWIGLTLDWLDRLAVNYTVNEDFTHYTVTGGLPEGFDYIVPGDLSSVAFPIMGAIVSGGEVEIGNVDLSDKQGDGKLVMVLSALDAKIITEPNKRRLLVSGSGRIDGGTLDINDYIDALPILAVAGCYAEKVLNLENCAIARSKECDRLSVMSSELGKMGADIDERPDQLRIRPKALNGASVDAHHDHRIAMALAIAALGATGETHISGAEVVNKSYPGFWQHLESLGADVTLKELP